MKRWNTKQRDIVSQKKLADALGVSPVIAQLLINRGISDIDHARMFLSSDVSELYNPFLMKGMAEAVMRLKQAIVAREKVLIHGDYDVDGITAVALLIFTLRRLGLEPAYYIPDRLTEGYGLSEAGIKEALRIGASLVVTVDCGISGVEEVRAFRAHNIDVIITDHHEVSRHLPPAYAIINPLQRGCAYPDKNLSGVSIAFKLSDALCSEFHSKQAWRHLDMVALGTVSDVAPLIGENRILVKEGLKLLARDNVNAGIKALIEISGLKRKMFGSFEIAFILGPRINAAGRLGSAREAVELLLTDDTRVARDLAKKLDEANRQRQRIENLTLREAIAKIDKEVNFKENKVIVLHNEDWHTGVIGIVASRISDRFYRPAILISTKDGVGRGSGRSIENFHLFEALMECEDILKEYGGHRYACGLTILEENLDRFKATINRIADTTLGPEDLIPTIDIDTEISLDELSYDTVSDILSLEPFGESNPRPVFCSRNLRLLRPPRIIKGEHIKLWVTDGNKNFEAIGFGLAREHELEVILNKFSMFDLAYSVSFNSWQGLENIQLEIKDIKPS